MTERESLRLWKLLRNETQLAIRILHKSIYEEKFKYRHLGPLSCWAEVEFQKTGSISKIERLHASIQDPTLGFLDMVPEPIKKVTSKASPGSIVYTRSGVATVTAILLNETKLHGNAMNGVFIRGYRDVPILIVRKNRQLDVGARFMLEPNKIIDFIYGKLRMPQLR
jgi:hypothetical protein